MTGTVVNGASATPAADTREGIRGVWWLSPVGAMLIITVPALWYAWSLDDSAYRAAWRTGKLMTDEIFFLFLAGALAFMVGGAIPTTLRRRALSAPWPGLSQAEVGLLQRISGWLFWGTVVGYLLLGGVGFLRGVRPADLIQAVVSADTGSGALKEQFAPIAGLTTFTQLGIAVVVVCAYLALSGDRRAMVRIAIVVAMSLPRAYLLGERLAAIELFVPMLAVFATAWVSSHRQLVRSGVRLAPILLLPLLVIVFGFFEFSRSWAAFYSTRSADSFASFAVQRLAGYYVTAFNNGALFVQNVPEPGRLPMVTMESFWSAPVIEQAHLYERWSAPGSENRGSDLLSESANPEFNSPCGLCAPFVDFGTAGGLLYLLGAGLVVGTLYVRFTRGGPIALLIYPLFVTGLFELPRYLYWATGRVAPPLVVLLILGVVLVRRRAAASRA